MLCQITVYVEFHFLWIMLWYTNMEALHLFATINAAEWLSRLCHIVSTFEKKNHLCSLLLERSLNQRPLTVRKKPWQTSMRRASDAFLDRVREVVHASFTPLVFQPLENVYFQT